jgi:uncharacterized protein YuzE
MQVIYDAATDALRIVFRNAVVEDFSEDRPGVRVDYDADDNIVALEIQDISKLTDDPRSLQHIVVNEPEPVQN